MSSSNPAAGPTGPDEPAPEGLTIGERLRLAISAMEYNQSFVTFADGKANALLLVNSIFLATAAGRLGQSFSALLVAASAGLAILLSLSVVYARLPGQMKRDRAKIFFWGHVCQRRSKAEYAADLASARPEEILESLARQVFELAQVVQRKFKAYQAAQFMTFLSAASWVLYLIGPPLHWWN
jgi:hypothetical protein